MFFCVVAASSPGQHFLTLFHAHDPQTSDMAKSRIMRRCFGAMGNRNLASRPIHDGFFLENKTILKPLHLQKFSPASLRTLGPLGWSRNTVYTLGSRHLPQFYKPCHKGKGLGAASTPDALLQLSHLFSWPIPSLVHQASFLWIQDPPPLILSRPVPYSIQ